MKMELSGGLSSTKEYRCDITRELDKLAHITEEEFYDWCFHYILVDNQFMKEHQFPIRIPGGTLGTLRVDDEFKVTSIVVDIDYVVKTYDADVNEQIKKFIGHKLEF